MGTTTRRRRPRPFAGAPLWVGSRRGDLSETNSDAPLEPSTGRSHPSARCTPDRGGRFFDARPVVGQPALDGLVRLLARTASWFLRAEASLVQPSRQVPGIERNLPFFLDQPCQAWRRPQNGRETMLQRTL